MQSTYLDKYGIKALLQKLIAVYRYCISPMIGHHCRFEPSCSVYASQALACFGLMMGLWYAFKRVMKCAPWHAGGYDPVPCNLRKED